MRLNRVNNVESSRIELYGRITSNDKKLNGGFDETIIFTKKATNLKSDPVADKQSYIKGIMLPPNGYKAVLLIRDSVNGKIGIKWIKFTVPKL